MPFGINHALWGITCPLGYNMPFRAQLTESVFRQAWYVRPAGTGEAVSPSQVWQQEEPASCNGRKKLYITRTASCIMREEQASCNGRKIYKRKQVKTYGSNMDRRTKTGNRIKRP